MNQVRQETSREDAEIKGKKKKKVGGSELVDATADAPDV